MSARMVALGGQSCEIETGEPRDTCINPCFQADDHHTVSHITIVDHGQRTRVTSKGTVHLTTWTPIMQKCR